jgi:hypothetical protein
LTIRIERIHPEPSPQRVWFCHRWQDAIQFLAIWQDDYKVIAIREDNGMIILDLF